MHTSKKFLVLIVAVGLVMVPGAAFGVPDRTGWDPVDGPKPADQHGTTADHLPASSANVKLVSKLELTDLPGGIADVGYFKGFAYLNAWGPHCPGGGGVHVVDVRDASNPVKVGFLPAETNAFPGEGVHIMEVNTPFFQGDLLLHNNEPCGPADLGMSMWDVTDPLNPVKIGQFGDTTPSVGGTYNSIHSVQGFTQPGKAFAVQTDNEEIVDVNIIDITNPFAPVQAADLGLENWPGALGSFANGDTVFLHDEQFKRIEGNDFLALSYWDAGQILLNVNDPYNPVFVGDSDYLTPDPEFPQFEISEGNSHESYWSSNSKFLLSTDEDFSPFRTDFEMTTGLNAGAFGAGEFGFTPSVDSLPGSTLNGPTVFGGRGCAGAGPNAGPDVVAGEPVPPPASAIPAAPGEEKTVVFSRGGCFFSTKIALGQDLGYDAVIIGQSHGGTRNGLLVDGFFCGGQGHDYDEQARAICIGHRAMHLMFNDTPSYTGPEGTDIPLGTVGEKYSATTLFDGWGYVNLHDATNPNLPIIDTYAVAESKLEAFASGFGDLSVHEVKTDPRRDVNLAYFSYYAAGFRVAEFGASGIREVGHFIDEGGNNLWGVFPIGDETAGHGYSRDHGRLQLAIDSLQGFLDANAGSPAADKVEDVLAKTKTALAELAKDPADRQAAAGTIEGAIGDLESAVDSGLLSSAEGNELLGVLADAARGLVQDAATEPIVGAGDPGKVSEGEKLLAQGDALRAAGAFKDAAAKYKDAVAKTESGRGRGVRPLILASDRDFGLYIFDYTGKRPKKG